LARIAVRTHSPETIERARRLRAWGGLVALAVLVVIVALLVTAPADPANPAVKDVSGNQLGALKFCFVAFLAALGAFLRGASVMSEDRLARNPPGGTVVNPPFFLFDVFGGLAWVAALFLILLYTGVWGRIADLAGKWNRPSRAVVEQAVPAHGPTPSQHVTSRP